MFLRAAAVLMALAPVSAAVAGPANTALPALADNTPVALQVTLNGYPTGLIGEFTVCDQQLCARGGELDELGFAIPSSQLDDVSPLRRSGIEYALDWTEQTLAITAVPSVLKPHRLGEKPARAGRGGKSGKAIGAFVTYDAAIHVERDSTVFNGLLDTRVFAGNYSAGTRVLVEAGSRGTSVTRLETAVTWSNVDRMERVTLGDSITGGLAQTRPVRFAGVQFARAFEQRPDLITYPLPEVRGQVAVPSNVAVLVNGVQRLTEPVAAGPFYMDRVPVSPGAGAVSIVTRDALGNALRSDMQVYVSEAMLQPGLTSFSAEAGFLRKSFAGSSNDYSSPLGVFTGRVGLPRFTVEGHAEFAPGLAMTTLGGSFNMSGIADVTAHAGASASDSGTGWSGRIGVERRTDTYRVGVSAFAASPQFRDLAAIGGDSRPELSILANAGVSLGNWGSFSVTHLEERGQAMAHSCCSLADAQYRLSISSLQYSVSRDGLFWSVNAFRDGVNRVNGISTSLSFQFSPRRQAAASFARNQRSSYGFDFRQSASQIGEFGWHMFGNLGQLNRFGAEAEFKSALADIGAAAFLTAGDFSLHGRASGSLVMLDGAPMLGPPVRDSFAMVSTDGAAGIPIYQDGRRVGTTNRNGRVLLPDVPSYVPVNISADQTGLESGLSLRQSTAVVTAMTRQGAGVKFGLRRTWSALVTLVDASGQHLPLGTPARFGGADHVVGYDGELFVESESPKVMLSVMPAEAKRCELPLVLTRETTGGLDYPVLQCG